MVETSKIETMLGAVHTMERTTTIDGVGKIIILKIQMDGTHIYKHHLSNQIIQPIGQILNLPFLIQRIKIQVMITYG